MKSIALSPKIRSRWNRASIWRIWRRAALAALMVGLAQGQTFSELYSFKGQPDGASPWAGLVEDASGNLYGTTQSGGTSNLGTVFKLDPAGNETVLHSFSGGADGASPLASVVLDPAGNLYGTTFNGGGVCNCGVVFKLDLSGNETILHSFSGPDGGGPHAGVILDTVGNLYGVTPGGGGGNNAGVAFKLDRAGNETVLHAFSGQLDGGYPEGGLLRDSAGNLYGTTTSGGGGFGLSGGTVFKLDSAGNFSILYAFQGGADGGSPSSVLIQDKAGNLYGTTSGGGVYFDECVNGCGVVFELDSSGRESVLYTFCSVIVSGLCSDGSSPSAGVVEDGSGNFYGTTAGTTSVIFKVSPGGNETVLYTFPVAVGMSNPFGGVIRDASGNLFGTALFGPTQSGSGVVFKLVPPGFALAASALTPGTVSPGGSATATVSLTDSGGFTGPVSLSCLVQPQSSGAPTCSISNSVDSSTPATLRVNTTGPNAAVSRGPDARSLLYALWLPLIGLIMANFRYQGSYERTGILRLFIACALLAGLASGMGCGGSNSSGGTLPGTYTIRVAGTAASLQSSASTTLTVN